MIAFCHNPVPPTKLTIPAEVSLSKKLMQRETVRETPVIFLKIFIKSFQGCFPLWTSKFTEIWKCHSLSELFHIPFFSFLLPEHCKSWNGKRLWNHKKQQKKQQWKDCKKCNFKHQGTCNMSHHSCQWQCQLSTRCQSSRGQNCCRSLCAWYLSGDYDLPTRLSCTLLCLNVDG